MNQTEHVLLLNMVVTHSGLKTWNVTLFGPFTKKKITFNISQLGCRDSSVWVSPYDHVKISYVLFSSVHSLSVVSDSLWPHGLQHARLPCPSPIAGAYSNPWPLSWWSHPSISSSVVSSSCTQSFPASGSFPVSVLHIRWPKYWSFSFSISPSNEYSGLISFRMDWLDLFAVQGTLKSLFQQHG